jgi:hypothetical protein
VSIVQLDHLTQEFGLKTKEDEEKKQNSQSGQEQEEETTSSSSNPEESSSSSSPTPAQLSFIRNCLPPKDRERLKRASIILKQRLILRLWLDDHGLLEYAPKFNSLGVNSIEDAYWFEDTVRLEETIGEKIVPMFSVARLSLPTGLVGLENLKSRLWARILILDQQSIWNTWGE